MNTTRTPNRSARSLAAIVTLLVAGGALTISSQTHSATSQRIAAPSAAAAVERPAPAGGPAPLVGAVDEPGRRAARAGPLLPSGRRCRRVPASGHGADAVRRYLVGSQPHSPTMYSIARNAMAPTNVIAMPTAE